MKNLITLLIATMLFTTKALGIKSRNLVGGIEARDCNYCFLSENNSQNLIGCKHIGKRANSLSWINRVLTLRVPCYSESCLVSAKIGIETARHQFVVSLYQMVNESSKTVREVVDSPDPFNLLLGLLWFWRISAGRKSHYGVIAWGDATLRMWCFITASRTWHSC